MQSLSALHSGGQPSETQKQAAPALLLPPTAKQEATKKQKTQAVPAVKTNVQVANNTATPADAKNPATNGTPQVTCIPASLSYIILIYQSVCVELGEAILAPSASNEGVRLYRRFCRVLRRFAGFRAPRTYIAQTEEGLKR